MTTTAIESKPTKAISDLSPKELVNLVSKVQDGDRETLEQLVKSGQTIWIDNAGIDGKHVKAELGPGIND